jgi:RNA polymerase sigma factor (sigma-70 family)
MTLPRLQDGEKEWFMREVYPHEEMLRAWLKSRYPSLSQVDEIVQEAYIRVLKMNRRRRLLFPKAYLFAAARNLCVDALRRHKVVQFKPLDRVEAIAGQGGDGAGDLMQKEEYQILTEAIQSLPEQCRRVVTLRKVYGLSAKEIASQLKLSHRTVENQLLIGMKKCREYYARLEVSMHKKGSHLK